MHVNHVHDCYWGIYADDVVNGKSRERQVPQNRSRFHASDFFFFYFRTFFHPSDLYHSMKINERVVPKKVLPTSYLCKL